MPATNETLMQVGTIIELAPAISAEVLSDAWVLHDSSSRGVVIGRVVELRVGERIARQRFWYSWGAPDCPLHHVDMEWVPNA